MINFFRSIFLGVFEPVNHPLTTTGCYCTLA